MPLLGRGEGLVGSAWEISIFIDFFTTVAPTPLFSTVSADTVWAFTDGRKGAVGEISGQALESGRGIIVEVREA